MSKSTLEKLLLEASSFTAKVEKQANVNNEAILKTAIKEEVSKFIKEATEEADEDMDFDEETADADTEDTTELDGEDDDASFDTDEESLGDDEMSDDMSGESDEFDESDEDMESDDMPLDVSAGMGDESDEFGDMGGGDTMDLSNLTMDELKSSIEDIVSQMGDNESIEFVKKPAFQINKKPAIGSSSVMGANSGMMPTTLDAESDDDTEMEFDLDDEDMDSEGAEDFGDEGMEDEESDDFGSESEEGDEDEQVEEGKKFNFSKVNNSKGGKNSPFANKGKKAVVTETDELDMVEGCQDESVYEEVVKENRQIKGYLKKMSLEIKGYKARETKAAQFIKESMGKLQSLALTNTNLALFVRLVNEHATSAKEKENMLKKFDAAKTVRESQITFNMLKESLTKRPLTKTPITKTGLTEAVNLQNKKVTIKEEKAFISKEQQRINELMNYKPNY